MYLDSDNYSEECFLLKLDIDSTMRYQLLTFLICPLIASASYAEQIVIAPANAISQALATTAPITSKMPSLADLLTIESSVSIFYSYAREIELSKLFTDRSAQSTLLVPTNKAVMALARKP